MSFKILFLFLVILNISCIHGVEKRFLHSDWSVRNGNNSINIPATVPGGIYSDLSFAKVLGDIYYRYNDMEYRWVGKDEWTYSSTFQVDQEILNKPHIDIVFEGLDTISTIILNNNEIGNTNNMFVRYSFNIKPYLQSGNNNLTVVFKSPIIEANRLHEEYAKNYVIPPLCVPGEYRGECHANLIRKMQASFSWDWGPAFPSVGIWKPVYIRTYDSAVIQDVSFSIKEKDEDWDIHVEVYLESTERNSNLEGLLTTTLSTDLENVEIFADVKSQINDNGEYKQDFVFSVPKAQVQWWWPNGYGQQPLYNLSVSFKPQNSNEISSKSVRVGFRTIELVQSSTEKGLTFYFKVNGIPIFAKGSNWIPANILPEKGADINDLKFLLQSSKDVHMNMLRVWGGGVYESDEFYELADEYGILIWQDLMFACSMYPVNQEFLDNVNLELRQQIRRLQSHPSVALWAGNNENESALRDNWYGTSSNFDLYKRDYITLYVDNIRKVVLENDQTRPFTVSSPSNGLQSEKEEYVSSYPSDPHFGDIHYYNYLMDGWDQNIYVRTRFCSEYGFQSLPSYETMRSSTDQSEDLVANSNFMSHRQHHPNGNEEMKNLILKQLNLPSESKENYLKTFIYFTQINQAMSYKAQTEHYRQWRSRTDEDDKGLTMGALYWQLNDVWPAPTWSSIDFKQNWKMVHYYAKKFFAPLLITANISPSKELTIFALSDLTSIVPNATLTVNVYSWKNMKPIYSQSKTIDILPSYSAIISQSWLEQGLTDIGCGNMRSAEDNCFLYFTLTNSNGESLAPDNFAFLAPLKQANGLDTPNLTAKITNVNNGEQNIFEINVSTDRITPFVWLEAAGIKGKFSDNGFLQITEQKSVQFITSESVTQDQLQSVLTVTSLRSSEHL